MRLVCVWQMKSRKRHKTVFEPVFNLSKGNLSSVKIAPSNEWLPNVFLAKIVEDGLFWIVISVKRLPKRFI